MRLLQVYDLYIAWHNFVGHSPKTIADYDLKVKRMFIQNGVGDIEVTDLTTVMVMDYVVCLRDRGLAENSVASYWACIRVFLNYCYEKGFSDIDWQRALPKFRMYKTQKEVYRDDEIMAIFSSIQGDSEGAWRKRAVFALAFDTGMRSGEILRMQDEDIHVQGSYYIKVRGTKGKADRTLPITYPTYEIIQRYRMKRKGSSHTLLFVNSKGGPLTQSSLRRYISTNIKGAGVKRGNMKYFRHSRITRWLMAGNSTMIVMAWAGHQKAETANNYWHYSNQLQAANVSFMDTGVLLSQIPLPKRKIKRGGTYASR